MAQPPSLTPSLSPSTPSQTAMDASACSDRSDLPSPRTHQEHRHTHCLGNVANVDTYFSLVNNYRTGDVDPFVPYLAHSALHASNAARESVSALDALPAQWVEMAKPRKGSADENIIPWLLERPVFDAHTAGVAEKSMYGALARLTEAGVISLVGTSQRHRAWAVSRTARTAMFSKRWPENSPGCGATRSHCPIRRRRGSNTPTACIEWANPRNMRTSWWSRSGSRRYCSQRRGPFRSGGWRPYSTF